MNLTKEARARGWVDEGEEEASPAYLPLPDSGSPKEAPAPKIDKAAGLAAAALFAAGITSLLVFDRPRSGTDAAPAADSAPEARPGRSGSALDPAQARTRSPRAPVPRVSPSSAEPGYFWSAPLAPFIPGASESKPAPLSPVAAAPRAEAPKPGEPMMERSTVGPRLETLRNLVALARVSGGDGAFRLLSLEQASFWAHARLGMDHGGAPRRAAVIAQALRQFQAAALSIRQAPAAAPQAGPRGNPRAPARLWRSLAPYAAAAAAPRTVLGTTYRAAATSMTGGAAPELITSGGPEAQSTGGAGASVAGAAALTAVSAPAIAGPAALPGSMAPVPAPAPAAPPQALAPVVAAPPPAPAPAPAGNVAVGAAQAPQTTLGGVGVGLNPAALPDMTNVDTNDDWWREKDCSDTKGCAWTRNAGGQLVLRYANGETWTKVSYDQAAQFGYRNSWLVEEPNGARYAELNSPLVFDLKGKGVRVSDRIIRYDIDGDGRPDMIHDIASSCGVLVFDADRDGAPGGSGRGLFGTGADLDGDGRPDGFKDGFEAFRAFIRKAVRERVLSARVLKERRLNSGDLSRLEKAYGLKMKVGSLKARAISLRAAGVDAVAIADGPTRLARNFDGQGNAVVREDGATFRRIDGTAGSYEDVFFWTQRAAFRAIPNQTAAPAPFADRMLLRP